MLAKIQRLNFRHLWGRVNNAYWGQLIVAGLCDIAVTAETSERTEMPATKRRRGDYKAYYSSPPLSGAFPDRAKVSITPTSWAAAICACASM
jgi:hypothetical protein